MKISEMVDGLTPPRVESFTRDRPDDVVELRLSVVLRDGRTFEIEMPDGVRPKVDVTVDRDRDDRGLHYGGPRSFVGADDSVRIVIEADTKDGRARDGGCLFRLVVRESNEVNT